MDYDFVPHIAKRGPGLLRQELYQSLRYTSLPALLRYEDRNSMLHSIESRVPFLTPQMAQFILGLPEEYILPQSAMTKYVFREAMRDIVPDAILDRKDKMGFPTPEEAWLKGELAPWVGEVLKEIRDPQKAPFLHYERIAAEWSAILEGRARFDSRIWRWVNIVKWVEAFQVEVS